MGQLLRAGTALAVPTLALVVAWSAVTGPAFAQTAPAATPAGTAAAPPDTQENLTVLGHRKTFETAPMPGPALQPPPDKPDVHLGRYKVSGDQSTPDGRDAQTGALIAPFGTAYTGASPVAGGLASHFEH
ncbi:hypothetical protein [Lichenicola sp.]|uniref:hypothetical protein n=1 Tax=Lichenicola sp. TaxID=2804529 RepID=UPI003B005890